jgi:hypothetical protein
VPVRHWVLSFPIPLRGLFAVHPELLAPVLQTIHRVIATHRIRQAGSKRSEVATGAVTLIQRFGFAAASTMPNRRSGCLRSLEVAARDDNLVAVIGCQFGRNPASDDAVAASDQNSLSAHIIDVIPMNGSQPPALRAEGGDVQHND